MTRTIKFKNCTATLHTPELTEDERLRRRKEFEQATVRFLIRVEEEKKAKCVKQ